VNSHPLIIGLVLIDLLLKLKIPFVYISVIRKNRFGGSVDLGIVDGKCRKTDYISKYNMNIRRLYSLFEKVNNSLNAQILKQRLAQTSIKE